MQHLILVPEITCLGGAAFGISTRNNINGRCSIAFYGSLRPSERLFDCYNSQCSVVGDCLIAVTLQYPKGLFHFCNTTVSYSFFLDCCSYDMRISRRTGIVHGPLTKYLCVIITV